MTTPRIGFAGMTHLGLNSAVAGAERGFEVTGFDEDAHLVDALRAGSMPVTEPDLNRLAEKNAARLVFTNDVRDLTACDVVYVAPDVPTNDQGESDLSPIDGLLDKVAPLVRSDASLVILSQVPPGFTRERRAVVDNLYYQVETLIFGRAIERALSPERYIVGCAEPREPLHDAYRTFLEAHGCPILQMRYESAELAKISINCCLVASISVANTLAELCEKIGADWSEIVPALKLDRRIGEYAYLAPGLGLSGGNLERDLATVQRFAAASHTHADIVEAWLSNSEHRKNWPYRILQSKLLVERPDARIAVLGLAYKENTHSIKNAASLALLAALADGRADVSVYDPVVDPSHAEGARAASSALDALEGADAAVIITPWDEFRDLTAQDLRARMSGHLIVDPYRMLMHAGLEEAGFDHVVLGVARKQLSA